MLHQHYYLQEGTAMTSEASGAPSAEMAEII
jgi:hypothetical protein